MASLGAASCGIAPALSDASIDEAVEAAIAAV